MDPVADAAAEQAKVEFGVLLTSARQALYREQDKAFTLDELRKVAHGVSLADLRTAIDAGRVAGHGDPVLAPYESRYTEIETNCAAASAGIDTALRSRDPEDLRQAI